MLSIIILLNYNGIIIIISFYQNLQQYFLKFCNIIFIGETIVNDGPIEEDKTIDQIREEPFTLPDGFQWDTLSLDDPFVLKELYTLLNENYVEDEDSMFRFDYQPHFLKWYIIIFN